MDINASALTFDTDFTPQESDHVASIPEGITTLDDLCAAIQRQLPVPASFTTGNWDDLSRVFCFPEREGAAEARWNGRTVLLHQDIPLLQQDRYEARIYLEIVIGATFYLQQCAEEQEQVGESSRSEQFLCEWVREHIQRNRRSVHCV